MRGKICMVTGANQGIGRETVAGLARLGTTVIAVARDSVRGEAAVEGIRAETGSHDVHLMLADLSSQAAVRDLARDFMQRYDRLHVLVNNAGAINTQYGTTIDGIETTFAVNHLAYFLLTNLLLPVLGASAPSRIVNVSSDAHRGGEIRFADLGRKSEYRGYQAYSQSKLANVLFTYELARRLENTSVTANCLHPGVVATGFGRNNSGFLRWGMRLTRPFLTKPARGAETSIYLASSPEMEGVTGEYFYKCQQTPSDPASYDEDLAGYLWDISVRMTGLAGSADDVRQI
ncbi:MAG: short-chain dehydrogenase [Chloroflexi bacterium]|nr:MAG: short-chain dehydrogenase [Chloroflexota bacterium]